LHRPHAALKLCRCDRNCNPSERKVSGRGTVLAPQQRTSHFVRLNFPEEDGRGRAGGILNELIDRS
jgi:hypothetical protein